MTGLATTTDPGQRGRPVTSCLDIGTESSRSVSAVDSRSQPSRDTISRWGAGTRLARVVSVATVAWTRLPEAGSWARASRQVGISAMVTSSSTRIVLRG